MAQFKWPFLDQFYWPFTVVTEERGQIVFLDTPGIHKPAYAMNRRMIQTVHDGLRDVDLAILMTDASIAFGSGENYALKMAGCARSAADALAARGLAEIAPLRVERAPADLAASAAASDIILTSYQRELVARVLILRQLIIQGVRIDIVLCRQRRCVLCR